MKPVTPVGILSYGVAIPKFRVPTVDIAAAHRKPGQQLGLGVVEKAVAAHDQDSATLAVDAARQARSRLPHAIMQPKAVYVGSESHPYAVKPTAAIVGEALGLGHDYMAADFEFACKAGTAAIQTVAGLSAAGMIPCGLAIGADVAQSKPGDPLEFAAAAGAAAMVVGSASENAPLLAELIATTSRTYDVPDFWRRSGERFPSHAGRFTGEPAYFRLISETVTDLLQAANLTIQEIDHVVFHMPNAKFPKTVAKRLGVADEQLSTGLTVTKIGNSYSACSLIGFAKVLDSALPNQTILLCSFGSGAGSDGFVWRTTDALSQFRNAETFGTSVQHHIDTKQIVDYMWYCKNMGKIT